METIFDHDPTEEELLAIFGSEESVEAVRAFTPQFDHDTNMAMLVKLMTLRNSALADTYLAAIKNPSYRFDIEYLLQETA